MRDLPVARVKIVKATGCNLWYSRLIGETFLVYETGLSYMLKADMDDEAPKYLPRYILRGDAEKVTDGVA